MADGFTVSVDDARVRAVFARFPLALSQKIRAAARISAESAQRTARRVVAKATQETARAIVVWPATKFPGYVVQMADQLSEDDLARRAQRRDHGLRHGRQVTYAQEKHVGLWLERGTRRGKPGSHTSVPRPFMAPAAALEQGPFRRAVIAAINETAEEQGLGD